MNKLLSLAVVGLGVFVQPAPPDLVVVNARVYTGEPTQPWAEAVSVRGNRIVDVGRTDELRGLAGPATRLVDAGGRLVIPGLNDAHVHPGDLPEDIFTFLEGPSPIEHDPTWDDIVSRMEAARRKAPSGGWILGQIGGTVLDDVRARRAGLDAISGDHPAMLLSFTGHALIANTRALRELGISNTEPDPPGGFYGREADGRTVNGEASEYACFALVRALVHRVAPRQQPIAFRTLTREAAGYGITSLHAFPHLYTEAGVDALLDEPVTTRVRLIDMPVMAADEWRPPRHRQPSGVLVRRSGIKFVVDGTPIERTMLMSEPYSDRPGTRGGLNMAPEALRAFLRRALAAQIQPSLHAAGDAAIDVVLDALETTGGDQWKALRPRIEHAYMFEERHVARALRLGVVIVPNPSHFDTGGATNLARFGEGRLRQWAPVRQIVAWGIPLALGSDGPLNPFLNLMLATTSPHALTREQALKAYTSGSAMAEHAEGEKGTLAPGKLADLAMLSQNIFDVPSEDLPKTVSVLTVVDGRVVHDALTEKSAERQVPY